MLVMSSRTHTGSGKLAPRLFPLQSLPEGSFIGSFPIEANCRSRGQCVGNILQNNYKKVSKRLTVYGIALHYEF